MGGVCNVNLMSNPATVLRLCCWLCCVVVGVVTIYSILFYFILFCFVLFYFISILVFFVLFYLISFQFILFHFILSYAVHFCIREALIDQPLYAFLTE